MIGAGINGTKVTFKNDVPGGVQLVNKLTTETALMIENAVGASGVDGVNINSASREASQPEFARTLAHLATKKHHFLETLQIQTQPRGLAIEIIMYMCQIKPVPDRGILVFNNNLGVA